LFFPYADYPNPPNYRPWVTWGLIAINTMIWASVNLPSGEMELHRFLAAHGYVPAAPSLLDLFSSMFLHGNFFHLAGNMWMLWIYGDNVEHRLGRLPYLLAYLATGVLAVLGFALTTPGSEVPLVGASGAISGVLGCYFLFFPENQIKIWWGFWFLGRFGTIHVYARWVLAFYVLIDNLLPLLVGFSSSVAYGAHLGGFVGGLGLAWGWRALLDGMEGQGPEHQAAALLARAERFLQLGQRAAALQYLMRAEDLDPDGPQGARARALMRRHDLRLRPR
jgi:membrane associated rhomboid family serine protease